MGGDRASDDKVHDDEWRATASARAGLAGNPSDALGGAALAVSVPALRAQVRVRSATRLRVRGPGDEGSWASLDSLDAHVSRFGYEGAERLVTAAIVTLRRHLRELGVALRDPSPFEVEWASNIPRSVGLAGSSALVVATIRAVAARWGATLTSTTVASLALSAERDELGIAGGWMDRAVQAHDAAVLVDAGEMRVVRPARPVELLVAWDPQGAAPSGRLHASLADRLTSGDPALTQAVDALVAVAHRATSALEAADLAALAAAVDESCELRRGLGALDVATAALVEVARGCGASATSAGSGGAVSVVCDPEHLDAVGEAFAKRGLPNRRVIVH